MIAPESVRSPIRFGPGWAILAIVLFALLCVSMSGYFGKAEKVSFEGAKMEGLLKDRVFLQELAHRFKNKSPAVPPSLNPKDLAELEAVRKDNAEAALLWIQNRTETHEPVSQDDLKPLFRSKNDADKTYAEIYGSKTLTLDKARQLAAKVEGKGFRGELAAVHALEKAGDAGARNRFSTFRLVALYGATSAVVLAFALGLFVWGIYAFQRLNGQLKPKGHPVPELDDATADAFAFRAAQVLLCMIGVGILLTLINGRLNLSTEALNAINSLAQVALVVVLYKFPAQQGVQISLRSIGWTTENLGKNILWGLCGALASIPVFMVMAVLGSVLFSGFPIIEHPAIEGLKTGGSPGIVFVTLLVVSIVAPIIEETCFRGTFLPAAAKLFKSIPIAIAVTSLCFAAIHPTGIPSLLPLASLGAMMSMLTYQTKSLVPAVVMHATHNLLTLLFVLAVY